MLLFQKKSIKLLIKITPESTLMLLLNPNLQHTYSFAIYFGITIIIFPHCFIVFMVTHFAVHSHSWFFSHPRSSLAQTQGSGPYMRFKSWGPDGLAWLSGPLFFFGGGSYLASLSFSFQDYDINAELSVFLGGFYDKMHAQYLMHNKCSINIFV